MAGFTLRPDDDASQYSEGIWSPYGPEPTEAERTLGIKQESFKIRMLTPKMIEHFDKVSTVKKWRNHQQVEEPDRDRKNELMYDYLIEDWEGIYSDEAKRQPAPCTLENKLILAGNSLDRANFIFVQGSLYANDDEARKAAQRESFRQPSQVSIGLSRAEV
jgi:hypothetical protein